MNDKIPKGLRHRYGMTKYWKKYFDGKMEDSQCRKKACMEMLHYIQSRRKETDIVPENIILPKAKYEYAECN